MIRQKPNASVWHGSDYHFMNIVSILLQQLFDTLFTNQQWNK